MTDLIKQIEAKVESKFKEVCSYHGCSSGDCPHLKQAECDLDFFKAGAQYMIPLIEKLIDQRDGALGYAKPTNLKMKFNKELLELLNQPKGG